MEILQGLNEVQKEALLTTEGAVLVTAGAGSGKTKLLTHRIAHLIFDMGVSQNSILAVTFTNKAAKEMAERVSKLIGQETSVWISTFHSMCIRILREYIESLNQGFNRYFSIYDESDSEKLLKQVIAECNLPPEEQKHYAGVISYCQNENMDIYEYVKNRPLDDKELIAVYEGYEKALEKNNALDFDHLLTKTYELLSSNKNVLNYYANKFWYIFVDEFQDTNKVQYDIVKLLSSVHHNIFAVGDEDQCIYTWRGANFRNIFNFKNDFAPVKLFKLEQNYRSTKSILDKANLVIKNNNERFDKVLWTDNNAGEVVESFEYFDEQQEAENVISKIIRLKSKGYKYSDIAVLMRINALSLPFEKKFLSYNIPYRIYGGFKFYERQEIKNIICYLRLFSNPEDEISLTRIINFPKRAIGDVAVQKLKEYAKDREKTLLEGMINLYNNSLDNSALYSKIKGFVETYLQLKEDLPKLPLDEFCKEVIDKFEIKSAYTEQTEENASKLMNIDVFVNSVRDFVHENGNDDTLGEFLESITLESDLDFMGEDDTVTLATIHSVKGLEFKVVILVGLEEGICPLSRSFDSNGALEEERRLMYVAMTRARERLILTHVQTRYLHGKRSFMEPSRYIEEADLSSPVKPKQNNFSDFYANDYSNNYREYNQHKPYKQTVKVSSFTNNINGYTSAKSILNEEEEKQKVDTSKYKAGQVVNHPKYGKGKIVAIVDNGECGEIMFDNFGKKTLILSIAPLEILGE